MRLQSREKDANEIGWNELELDSASYIWLNLFETQMDRQNMATSDVYSCYILIQYTT